MLFFDKLNLSIHSSIWAVSTKFDPYNPKELNVLAKNLAITNSPFKVTFRGVNNNSVPFFFG